MAAPDLNMSRRLNIRKLPDSTDATAADTILRNPFPFTIFFLEVFLHSKVKLLNENLFESIQIILLVENEHCLLVVDGVNRAETQRAVAISYQDSIAGDTSCTLVSIGKSLDI